MFGKTLCVFGFIFSSAHVSEKNNLLQCLQMVIGRLTRNAIQAWQVIAAARFSLVCYV